MKEEKKNKKEEILEKKEEVINENDETIEEKIEITKEEVEAWNNKAIELEKKVEILNNEVLKSKAELINYRKRKDEETNKMLKYANEDLILELLPIIDNFERAISMEKEDSNLINGVKMIYTSLTNLLNKFDVKEIDCLNKPFDASMHHAVAQEEKEGQEDIVIEIFQKGYILKDKLLRPAMVKVGK